MIQLDLFAAADFYDVNDDKSYSSNISYDDDDEDEDDDDDDHKDDWQ